MMDRKQSTKWDYDKNARKWNYTDQLNRHGPIDRPLN